MAGAKCGQNVDSVANPKKQILAERRQFAIKFAKAFCEKIIMPLRHVRLLPEGRFKDIERDDRPGGRRRGKREVNMNSQIALEPHYFHNMPPSLAA